MKLAYFGYDKTALKVQLVLEQYFTGIDYYLVKSSLDGNSANNTSHLDLLNIPIMTSNVCIPSDEVLRTTQHKLILHQIKNEYNFFKKNIFTEFAVNNEELTGTKRCTKKQFNLADITSVIFNKKTNKHGIQIEEKNQVQKIMEYDYLIMEGHQLVCDYFQDKKQNIISRFQTQSYVILSLEFLIEYKLHKQYVHHDFIFIDNILLRTIFDNWYFCSLSQNKINVALYIPSGQDMSEEFLDFISQRTYKLLSDSLEAFAIGELVRHEILPSNGFIIKGLKINNRENAAVFPSFTFWSQNKVNDYIKSVFIAKNITKNKKNTNLFREKETS